MIILDTNVLSALRQTTPDAKLIAWLDRQPADALWVTSVTVFEARFGLASLTTGRRRSLELAFEKLLEEDPEHRVLDFARTAAESAAALAAQRRRADRPIDIRDTLIAGITVARRATLATRNLCYFQDLNVPVVDPWTD